MTDRIIDPTARVLDALSRFPGHVIERVAGLYLAGWGLVAMLATQMFESGPLVYAVLASGFEEWVYGILFVVVGILQAAFARPEQGADSRTRRRLAVALVAAACLVGLSISFAPSGAWSGVYSYGFLGTVELALVARLRLLVYAHTRGIHVETTTSFRAFRASSP